MDSRVLFFHEMEGDQLSLVGGKGLNLGILTKAGFPVPGGFCVTSQVFEDFLTINELSSFLAEGHSGEVIRAKLLAAPLPDYLEGEVRAALTHFEEGESFGVRSSATAEDLPHASFAGQQDTYLNVAGLTDILEAIRRCWASLYTDRAMVYREKQGIDHSQVSMAVVIQKMVLSEKSGILFTADPVSENRRLLSIDAGYGLGEALVSGIVTPDLYQYDKREDCITQKRVALKTLAIYPTTGGGTKQVTLEEEVAVSQVLGDEEMLNLARLGKKIEEFYGTPQDIEWCVEKGRLFIVQSRPITSLFPLVEPVSDDGKLHPHFSFGHAQMMLAPLSPTGIDILRMFFRVDPIPFAAYKPVFIKKAAGRIYIDISFLLQYRKLRRPFAKILGNVDLLVSQAALSLIESPGFSARIARHPGFFRKFVHFIFPVPLKAIWRLQFAETKDSVALLEGFVEGTFQTVTQKIQAADSLRDRLEAIYGSINKFRDIIQNAGPYLLPGLISMKKLESMEKALLGSEHLAQEVLKGLEGNVTSEMGLLIGDLADQVRKSPALRQAFQHREFETFFQRVEALEGEEDFKARLAAFMKKYGVRAAGEIDIAIPRWCEDPAPFVNAVVSMLDGMTEGQHRAEFLQARKEALAAEEDFITQVRQTCGRRKAKQVARFIKVARDCLPIREHPKYMMMHIFYEAKKALLEEGEKLVAAGRLEQAGDIFFFELWELEGLVESGADMKALVQKRKADYERYQAMKPPRFVTGEGELIKTAYRKENLPQGALVGVGVSAGVVEGIAKVILDPKEANLEKGEILVAPYTDPGWTTLFINAAGLITEVGGMLTHGTVVAREYGIPAVVSCENATTLIKTGQKIRLDGNNGFVLITED